MRKPIIIAAILVFLCLSLAVAQVHEPPLPANLKIRPPAAGVSPRLSQLSGVWEGSWDFKFPPGGGGQKLFPMDITGRGLKIAIVAINPPRVKAIYSYGGSTDKPGKWFRVRNASVSGDNIVLTWGKPGEKRTLTLRPSGTPTTANATLELESTAKVLKATLRKK
ncbi:MAG: hypothetical protein P8X65_06035 [Syntrophobacterales bacterium]